ncbi:UNC-like C-terminal-domain-containing protein [Desarmillaria tabescens]|uniref:UNC-like C-terminal-domain-containing protein n=1 Tax=Armillaria tabescens TaxID=1929756 RepID=A0AA39TQR8_ARMTA|nr:UNC-like C-terminal-domain-containing protein [Desarmillaria tabescens]KAK0467232.1 UNC-like C-terminal-domain-containing protein [Desarmillaria tabescens]
MVYAQSTILASHWVGRVIGSRALFMLVHKRWSPNAGTKSTIALLDSSILDTNTCFPITPPVDVYQPFPHLSALCPTMMVNLPTAFVALALASSVFTASPTSFNDSFCAISTAVSREAPPVYCLTSLEPVEPTDTDAPLFFEESKEKQAELQKQKQKGKENGGECAGIDGQTSPFASYDPTDEPLSSHFQVPIADRFNYAALECSARVRASHRSAKSPSSILSYKRDRYMLSPCTSKDKQFLVVELCDEVQIDTVQLANSEPFSGVFKDLTVSVAKTYSTGEEGWTVAGTYRAKNIQGVQSFHPPTSLSHDFYRYIRIDFHSHYGNEYYCPISLLRVHGLHRLDQGKWEQRETEHRVKEKKSCLLLASTSPSLSKPLQTPLRLLML